MKGLFALLLAASCLTVLGQAEYCLEGTVWDDELQGCIVANPADINLDGCVQLGDLLDLLTAYGDCGVASSCGTLVDDQGIQTSTFFECNESSSAWTFFPQTAGTWNNVTVDWGDGSMPEFFLEWSETLGISHTYSYVDHQTFTLTFTTATCSVTATLEKSVVVNPAIVVPEGWPTAACAPATLSFVNESSSVTPDTEFTWWFDDGTTFSAGPENAGAIVNHLFDAFIPSCQREVTLCVTNGCRISEFGMPACVTIDCIQIWDKDSAIIEPSAQTLFWPDNTLELSNVSEKVCLNNGNTQQRMEQWNFNGPYGPEGISEIDWRPWINSNPITLTFPSPGEYEVSLAIENYCGISDTSIVIVVHDAVDSIWECGDPFSYQGYDYATVLIGEQCWFAENLRSENYRNGDAIPTNLSDSEWGSVTSGAMAVFGEGSSECFNSSPDGNACDESWSLSEYGRLYNWHAVDDSRGLCPSGWHVPTDEEWTVMTDHLGGESIAGVQMKTTYGWFSAGNGTNTSGFSGLPGGHRFYDGYFSYAGWEGFWWSSSPYNSSFAWLHSLNGSNVNVFHYISGLPAGYSVRCIKDAE